MASKRVERAKAKGTLATELAITGAAVGSLVGPVGGVVGGSVGGLAGLIIGDATTVFPMDMVAIPAFEYASLNARPSFMIYIKEGEVLTQVIPTDAMEATVALEETTITTKKRTRAKGAGLPKKYAKMGFKKGWAAYKRTPGYKAKQARKKKASKKRKR
tara:strand:- start:1944 stop:2420 length:477 start_codon:yes stop_codon:yes gene_type:complete